MQELRIEGGAGEGVDNILSAAFHLLHSTKIYRSFDFRQIIFFSEKRANLNSRVEEGRVWKGAS